MLKILRKYMKHIMWVLIVAFALWGAGTAVTRRRRGPDYAGVVFGKRVSFDEYSEIWTECTHQALLMYGENLYKILKFLDLNTLTWDRIILIREAKRRRFKAKDEEVIEVIMGLPVFQRDGRFDKGAYERLVQYYFRTTPRAFEEGIRNTVLIAKLQDAVISEVTTTPEEVRKGYKHEREKGKISYILVEPKEFLNEIKLSSQELQEYYNKNKVEFKRPEEVNVEYIASTFAAAKEKVKVTEEDIKKYYEENLKEFEEKVPVEEGKEEKKEEKEEKPTYKPLKEVKDHIEKHLLTTRAHKQAQALIDQASDRLVDEPRFPVVAGEFGLEASETGYFAEEDEIPGIGYSPAFARAAFDLQPEEIGIPIQAHKGFYIIRQKAKRPPRIPPFEEVQAKVKEKLTNIRVENKAREKAAEFLSTIQYKLSAGAEDLQAVANELNLELHKTEAFARAEYIPGLGVAEELAEAAFGLNVGEVGKDIAKTPKGYCIYRLDELTPIDEETFEKEKEEFEKKFLFQKKQKYYAQWFKELKQKANLVSYVEKTRTR